MAVQTRESRLCDIEKDLFERNPPVAGPSLKFSHQPPSRSERAFKAR